MGKAWGSTEGAWLQTKQIRVTTGKAQITPQYNGLKI